MAFLLLHHAGLSKAVTRPLAPETSLWLVRALLSCCEGRVLEAQTASAMAEVVVRLWDMFPGTRRCAPGPPGDPRDSRLRSEKAREPVRRVCPSVDMNIAAEAVLDTVLTSGCLVEVPSWGALVSMCDGRRLLEYQTIAAAQYLREQQQLPLSKAQLQILEVAPPTTSYLAKFCSCGCLREGRTPCDKCSRAHYFSRKCLKRLDPST